MGYKAVIKVFRDSETDMYGKVKKEGGEVCDFTIRANSQAGLHEKVHQILGAALEEDSA